MLLFWPKLPQLSHVEILIGMSEIELSQFAFMHAKAKPKPLVSSAVRKIPLKLFSQSRSCASPLVAKFFIEMFWGVLNGRNFCPVTPENVQDQRLDYESIMLGGYCIENVAWPPQARVHEPKTNHTKLNWFQEFALSSNLMHCIVMTTRFGLVERS